MEDLASLNDCRFCGDGDPVPARGYWKCPVCDAEWNTDDDAEDNEPLPDTEGEN